MAAVTIREEPVETQELPEATAEPSNEPSIPEEPPREAEEEPLPRRKPGRPQGSKSKEPGKPRKPRAKKVVVQEEAVVEPPQEELPRAIPGSFPIPEEAYDLRAAKMLRLLQIQGDLRKQQKRQMYSSWFR